MRRLRAALALLGFLAWLYGGSVACAAIFTHVGAAAYWATFVVYAFGGIWLLVLFKRAVWR